ncbi:MAG: ImmA/IrrE family metallo-endopeptidase [Acidobacteria bacterium]|nr:ImmA/IrrE family metallo-endopeptidase [Acidobacteriota bacterium]
MQLEIIKTDSAYAAALDEIDRLIDSDPDPDTPDGGRLELLVHLVSNYEEQSSSLPDSDAVESILFRMDQMGLKQTDLVPYIGSRSKVSEVLSRKRQLTLSMVQALNSGLGIPADVLIKPTTLVTDAEGEDWLRYPAKEMCARGWIPVEYKEAKASIARHIKVFFDSVGGLDRAYGLNKTSNHVRSGREMNRFALSAWSARIIQLAKGCPPPRNYDKTLLNLGKMQEMARLSVFPDGPLRAQAALRELGISLVVEPALPRTYLDGSAILTFAEHPIIGLTLRYDRLDNFWFTLMHELSHLYFHADVGRKHFYDDLDVKHHDDPLEVEADESAAEALIPSEKWASSPARVFPSRTAILRFAQQIKVHPAIVAGRVRKESNTYHVYNDLVGHGRARVLFGLTSEEN